MIQLYTYKGCSSCRNASKWLQAHRVPFEERPIRETPPSASEIRKMLGYHEQNPKKLFNTSGRDYRSMGLSAKLPSLSTEEVIELLTGNGNLIKRPFVLGNDFGTVGFDPEKWAQIDWPRA